MKNFTAHKQNRAGERGNVILLIFIAILLFAALSFAVSSVMNSGDPDAVSKQTSILYADSILEYGRVLRSAVQDLRINGCLDTEISFENSVVAGYAFASRDECEVFNPDGGGVNYTEPDGRWLNSEYLTILPVFDERWTFTGGIQIVDVGTTSPELTAFLFSPNDKVCDAVNERAGIIGAPPSLSPTGAPYFTGTYATATTIGAGGSAAAAGHPFFCWEILGGVVDGARIISYTLIAR